jgi:hypothetical protein
MQTWARRRNLYPGVENIGSQIGELSSEELAVFCEWFTEFDASAWDRQVGLPGAMIVARHWPPTPG